MLLKQAQMKNLPILWTLLTSNFLTFLVLNEGYPQSMVISTFAPVQWCCSRTRQTRSWNSGDSSSCSFNRSASGNSQGSSDHQSMNQWITYDNTCYTSLQRQSQVRPESVRNPTPTGEHRYSRCFFLASCAVDPCSTIDDWELLNSLFSVFFAGGLRLSKALLGAWTRRVCQNSARTSATATIGEVIHLTVRLFPWETQTDAWTCIRWLLCSCRCPQSEPEPSLPERLRWPSRGLDQFLWAGDGSDPHCTAEQHRQWDTQLHSYHTLPKKLLLGTETHKRTRKV